MSSTNLINTNASYDFKDDISIGENGEEVIKNFLVSKGYTFIKDNKDNKYDLLMSYNQKQYKYEIKTDVFLSKERDTGNMTIEFSSRKKDSGIRVTESDYFVYFIPKLGEIWNIKTSDLREMIYRQNFKVVNGGDKGSDTLMYLIKRKKFKKYFRVHKIDVI